MKLVAVLLGFILDLDTPSQPTDLPDAKVSVNIYYRHRGRSFAEGRVQRSRDPFKYWDHPFQQYLGVPGSWGQFLGFWATFMQACVSNIRMHASVLSLTWLSEGVVLRDGDPHVDSRGGQFRFVFRSGLACSWTHAVPPEPDERCAKSP